MFKQQPSTELQQITPAEKDDCIDIARHFRVIYEEHWSRIPNYARDKTNMRHPNADGLQLPAFSPIQLQLILNSLTNHPDPYRGIFFSALIQESYNAGWNNFVFTNDAPLPHLFSRLRGTYDRPLETHIDFPLQMHTAYTSHHQPPIPTLAYLAESSEYLLITNHGAIGEGFARWSQNLTLINYGHAPEPGERAQNMHIENYASMEMLVAPFPHNQILPADYHRIPLKTRRIASFKTIHPQEFFTYSNKQAPNAKDIAQLFNEVSLIDTTGTILKTHSWR